MQYDLGKDKHFFRVEAAGGAVVSADGKILMMMRRGVWDLPKGHIEEGETERECAAREVCEECGLVPEHLTVGNELARTVHRYFFERLCRHEEKHTVWFRMEYSGDPHDVKPQSEEGITDLAWFTPDEAVEKVAASYPAIREVIENLTNNIPTI